MNNDSKRVEIKNIIVDNLVDYYETYADLNGIGDSDDEIINQVVDKIMSLFEDKESV